MDVAKRTLLLSDWTLLRWHRRGLGRCRRIETNLEVAEQIAGQIERLQEQLAQRHRSIAEMKKTHPEPIEVEAADVSLCLCPDAVYGDEIQVLFAKEKVIVGIAMIPLAELLKRLKFGKTLRMWDRMNVVKVLRCDARKENIAFFQPVSEDQFERLKDDLVEATGNRG